jgi:hypothetical protein
MGVQRSGDEPREIPGSVRRRSGKHSPSLFAIALVVIVGSSLTGPGLPEGLSGAVSMTALDLSRQTSPLSVRAVAEDGWTCKVWASSAGGPGTSPEETVAILEEGSSAASSGSPLGVCLWPSRARAPGAPRRGSGTESKKRSSCEDCGRHSLAVCGAVPGGRAAAAATRTRTSGLRCSSRPQADGKQAGQGSGAGRLAPLGFPVEGRLAAVRRPPLPPSRHGASFTPPVPTRSSLVGLRTA